MLPAFSCKQFAKCNEFNGRCDCPPGFGTDDCAEPVCGGLSDGLDRPVRNSTTCECSDGWSGINCNSMFVCFFFFLPVLEFCHVLIFIF